MPHKQSPWEVYKKNMSQLNHGDAVLEPAPLPYFERIRPGDVGYMRRGGFHLLFHADPSSGRRELGSDVPRTFKQLDIGPVFNAQPRDPGYLSSNTVQEVPNRTSIYPTLEPRSSISFRLTGDQGAALLTKYPTYRTDIQLERTFEEYTKEHYASWVAFARERGHGNDVKPVLVTGVDMTRDFAMMSYSDSEGDLTATFTISAPGAASVWGSWRKTGGVHTNCGPQPCHPPSSAQTEGLTSSSSSRTEAVSDEHSQCVFIRYYTVRRRLGIPRVIRAAAGPHDLGPGPRDDEKSSASGSDAASSLFDDDGDDDKSSISSIGSESDIVVHNTTPDERDDFDTIADYIFQNSDADSVLIHHRDITLLRESGVSTDLFTRLVEKQPPITVDGNGVGMIGRLADPRTNIWSNDPLGATPSAPLIEREAMNGGAPPEPQSPSRQEHSPQHIPNFTQDAAIDAGGSASGSGLGNLRASILRNVRALIPISVRGRRSVPEHFPRPIPRNRAVPIPRLLRVADKADSGGHTHPSASRPADGVGNEKAVWPSVESPRVGTENVGESTQDPNSSPAPGSNDMLPSSRYVESAQDLLPSLTSFCLRPSPEGINVVGNYPISAGGFADIWKGTLDGRRVALKSYRCYMSSDVDEVITRLHNEVHVHNLLQHGGVELVPFVGVYSTETHPFGLVYEYMENLDLARYLINGPGVGRLKLLTRIARSLKHMHDLGVAHGKLRTENILVDEDGNPRIAGLGNAYILSPSTVEGKTSTDRVPRGCTSGSNSLEMSQNLTGPTHPTKASDVYAFGVIAWEVFTGQPLFNTTEIAATRWMLNGDRPPRPDHPEVSDQVWRMIRKCWHDVPSRRMSISEALAVLETEIGRASGPRTLSWA